MSIIFTADLHLTDKPQDDYRWGIFAWLVKQVEKHGVKQIILGGDVTDAKDRHSAMLTNRLVGEIDVLSRIVEIIWIMGNHDRIDENNPFFGFLSRLKNVLFATTAMPWPMAGTKRTLLLLPNTRDYKESWKYWIADDFRGFDLIFGHQTFDGCKSETGYTMDGIPPSVFEHYKGRVYSGDIHKPQMVGKKIEYVGAPYRIRFGDDFEPRVLLINDDLSTKDLHYPTLFKATIDILPTDLKGKSIEEYLEWYIGKEKFHRGDQIKIRAHLTRAIYPEWPKIKREIVALAERMGILLTGPELVGIPDAPESGPKRAKKRAQQGGPGEVLDAYAEGKGLSDEIYGQGRGYLQQAMK